jgi:YD repeat-containing protein
VRWPIALIACAAWALPPALLGPDGPAWFGTVPPGQAAEGDGRPVAVVVDPRSGMLSVVERDAPGLEREWDGRRWAVDGGGVDADWPPRDGFSYELDEDGLLVSATSRAGVRRRYLYDADGRLVGILWQDGGRLAVRYAEDGRVRRIDGPGNARRSYQWGAQGDVAVRDALGRLTRVRPVAGGDLGAVAWEVGDAAGRVVRTWFRDAAATETVAWQDPRGRITRVIREEDQLEVLGPTGEVWRVVLDDTGRPGSVSDPLGGVWRWERGASGRVRRVVDATGRITVWDRDAEGRIRGVERSGQVTRIERDTLGHIRAIRDPTGGEVRLERDEGGRITEVLDAGGSALRLARDGRGRVTALVSRAGGRWSLSYDLLGRPDRVVDPTDRVVVLERDSSGRLVAIEDSRAGRVSIGRSADGRVTAVSASDGRTLGLVRDPLGRITAVRLPSGGEISLERDAAGEISRVVGPWGGVPVARDGRGLPLQVGPGRWSWDAAGRLTRVGLSDVDIELRHDAAGRLEGARSGPWGLEIARDGAGRPVGWRGSDPAVVVQRDPAGRIVREETAQGVVSTTWDPRGRVERVQIDGWSWRWSRDAAGRTLRLLGPGGLQLGVDHDPAGRLKLVRLPGGALVRWEHEGDLTHQTLVEADGRPRATRTEARDAAGRVLWWQEGDAARVELRRDADGRLVGEGTAEAPTWRFSGSAIEGPAGATVRFDPAGRIASARPVPGPPAWGVATTRLEVAATPGTERIARMLGDGGEVALSWDPVGRLAAVSTPAGLLRVVRDARGRVAGWQSPAEGAVPLAWLPDDAEPEGRLLVSGGASPRTWLPGPLGPAGFATAELVVGIAVGAGGDPLAVQSGRDPSAPVRHTPMGFPDSGAAGLVGADGWLQPFAGGPLLRGARAVDPVSGRAVDGLSTWPWAPLPVRGTRNPADLRDPDAWAPEGPWADPLALLGALGVLPPVDGGRWWTPAEEPPAVSWLPAATDRPAPPLGPGPGALPLQEDLLARCAVSAALPGGQPLHPLDPLAAIISDEIALDGLPPGIVVPGLEWLGPRGGGCGGSILAASGGSL